VSPCQPLPSLFTPVPAFSFLRPDSSCPPLPYHYDFPVLCLGLLVCSPTPSVIVERVSRSWESYPTVLHCPRRVFCAHLRPVVCRFCVVFFFEHYNPIQLLLLPPQHIPYPSPVSLFPTHSPTFLKYYNPHNTCGSSSRLCPVVFFSFSIGFFYRLLLCASLFLAIPSPIPHLSLTQRVVPLRVPLFFLLFLARGWGSSSALASKVVFEVFPALMAPCYVVMGL